MRRIAIPITTLLIAALAYGGAQTLAQENTSSFNITQRLAERFSLNEGEVEAFFDEVHEERKLNRQAFFEAMLDEAVENEKISQGQKQLIIDKFDELRAQDGSFQDHHERREELESWAYENGIDLSVLMSGRGHHVKFGRGGMHM